MSLPLANVLVGELRVDPSDQLTYRFNGTSWDIDGAGTPSSVGFPAATTVGEIREDVASGFKYRANGTVWVLLPRIPSFEIPNGSITNEMLADNSVTASKIAANAVGASEIAADAVGDQEIAMGAVGASEIATGAVGSAEILDGTILPEDIAATAPFLVSAERLSNTGLRVTLSEDIDATSALKANDGGFVVFQTGAPATTYAVTATVRAGGDASQIELTIADAVASAAAGLTVTYATGGNGTVTDLTSVPLATDATGVVIPSWA